MRPSVEAKSIGSGIEMAPGSTANDIDRRRTPDGARVVGSNTTSVVSSDGEPASATTLSAPTRRPSSSVKAESTSPSSRPGWTWTIRSRPSDRAIATIEPSGRKP